MDLNRRRCYQIIAARDRRYDGRFFTAVVTTGVYCRPICPARTPKLVNVRFFGCAAAAEAAGFRPCRRCRPDAAPDTPAWLGASSTVSRALRLIAAGGLDDGGVEALAGRLGIGERQLRRLFAEHLGATPSAVAQTRRVHFARRLLDDTDLPMAEVALHAGFRSVRQFNHAMRATFGCAPGALRRAAAGGGNGVLDNAAAGGANGALGNPAAGGANGALGNPAAGGANGALGNPAAGGGNGVLRLRLPFRPPFDWAALAGFMRPRATPGVEFVDDDGYHRTITTGDRHGTLHVAPDLERNQLLLRIEPPATGALLGVVTRVRRLFDLDAVPLTIGNALRGDAELAPLVDEHPGMRVPGAWDPFELAVRAVLGQQVTVRAATTLAGRLVEAYGEPLPAAARLTHLFPPPERLTGAPLETIGLTRARARTLRELARAAGAQPDLLEPGAAGDLEGAVARLTALPGIGPWTAHYIAMRALREPDAFPAGDLGLRCALGRLRNGGRDAGPPAPEGMLRQAAKAWRPWRAYAALHLWTGLAEGE